MHRVIQTPKSKIGELRKQFGKRGVAVNFDFRTFCSENIGIHRSDVFTHYLHPYPAKLLPYIPAFFLSDEAVIGKTGTILDPFAGSGTVLLEALVNPHVSRTAFGVEINPLARLVSRVKTTPLSIPTIRRIYERIVKTPKAANSVDRGSQTIERWFSKTARHRLEHLLAKILEIESTKYRDFFLVCFSKIIRDCSIADPNIPPPVKLRPIKYKADASQYREMREFLKRSSEPDVAALFDAAVSSNLLRLKAFALALQHNRCPHHARIIWDDAQRISIAKYIGTGAIEKTGSRRLPAKSINGIITSPPYLTAQKYVRSTKLELCWLGMADDLTIPKLDCLTIGNERPNLQYNMGGKKGTKADLLDAYRAKIPLLKNTFDRTAKQSLDRALEIGQYFQGMSRALQEMYRVLCPNASAVLVLGDSKVNGRPFPTHRLLAAIAQDIGFELSLILRDPIRTRGMWINRHKTGGRIEDEYVLILQR